MKRYKLLTKDGYYEAYVEGDIYDESFKVSDGAMSVGEMAKEYPEDWELVEQEKVDEYKEIFSSLQELLLDKDKKYGNSALQPLNIFAPHHNYGSRIDEKLARIKNGKELKKNDVADIINGLILICSDKGWTNFDDLKD